MIVYKIKNLSNPKIKEKHDNNNKEIYSKIMKFMEHNNLTADDFFVGGSSCYSYMDYLILHHVRDIDVFLLKDIEVEKTEGIDVIVNKAIKGYTPELIQKNGINFLSPWHAITKCATKALLYQKKQSILYFQILLDYIGMTAEDFYNQFMLEVEQHVFPFTDKDALNIVKNNMFLLKYWELKPVQIPSFLSAIVIDNNNDKPQRVVAQGKIPNN